MFSNSSQLSFGGKLFRNPGAAFCQWLIGFVVALATVVLAAKLGVPFWLSVVLAATAATGPIQLYLLKISSSRDHSECRRQLSRLWRGRSDR
jgi:hypothetical protein